MSKYIGDALDYLESAIDDLELGFVACSTCGDQEDTKDLDCMDELKLARSSLREALAIENS